MKGESCQLIPGKVLMLIDSEKRRAIPYRVLYVTQNRVVLIIIDRHIPQNDSNKVIQVPQFWDKQEIEKRLVDKTIAICTGAWIDWRLISRWNRPDGKGREESKQNYELIRELVEDEPDIFKNDYRNRAIVELANNKQVSQGHIRSLITRYWVNGKNPSWLVNHYFNSGVAAAGKFGITGPKRLSHPNREKRLNSQVNAETREQIKKYASIRKNTEDNNGSIRAMYLDFMTHMIDQSAAAQAIREYRFDLDTFLAESIVNFDQFKYWFLKYVDSSLLADVQAKVENKYVKGIRGRASDLAYRLGTYVQIDACFPGVRLVDANTKKEVLPFPTVYFAVEPLCQMVIGVDISFEDASVRGIRKLINNMCEDKVEFCKSLGIEITQELWPWHYLPKSLFSDRGEGVARAVDDICFELGLGANVTPPYRPPSKGIVEGMFKEMKIQLFNRLPGTVNDHPKPGDPDTTKFATMTCTDFSRLLVACVICHNLGMIKVRSAVDPLAAVLGVGQSPVERFHYLKEYEYCDFITISKLERIVKLLPREEGKITARGVEFAKSIYYTSDRLESLGLFKLASIGRDIGPIELRIDERNLSYAFALINGGYVPIHLTDNCLSAFFGRNLQEARQYIDLQRRASLYSPEMNEKLKILFNSLITSQIEKSNQLALEAREGLEDMTPTRKGGDDAKLAEIVAEKAAEFVNVFKSFKDPLIFNKSTTKEIVTSNQASDSTESEYDLEDMFR